MCLSFGSLMNIALITARGGSKGLPRKNVLSLAGKPLIAWTIEEALCAPEVDEVYVTTEDAEIAQVSESYGAKIIDRPMSLAQDETGSEPVVAHALNFLVRQGLAIDSVFLLQPTSPLRTREDIADAYAAYVENDADCVVSVYEPASCIAKAYTQCEDGSLKGLFSESAPYTRRQDLPVSLLPNGAIYIFSCSCFLEDPQIPKKKVFPYIMSSERSIDIDTQSDLEKADKIIMTSRQDAKVEFSLSGRMVGIDYPPLVIVEIGINHEGSLKIACEMVDAAVSAGAEVIKHQTHVVEDEMSQHAKKVIPGNTDVSIYEVMERCALSEEEEIKLKEYVESKGAIFISTPFSRAAAERLERMNVSAYKIGSGECNNYPLLELVASYGKPIILSTGMNDILSIRKSVSILEKYSVPYCLLHCTNVYPTPDALIRLGGVEELAKEFPAAVVGLSDHSLDNLACLGAVAVGASVLERHFTDSKERPGPDIVCSMDPKECSELISLSKRMQQMRGGKKGAVEEEQPTVDFAYASVVTIAPIGKGEIFTKDNLWVKRPGTGDFLAEDFDGLLGKKASCDLLADVQLQKGDVAGG